MNTQADDLKSAAVLAYAAWEILRIDPLASRAQIEAAAEKFCKLSDQIKRTPETDEVKT